MLQEGKLITLRANQEEFEFMIKNYKPDEIVYDAGLTQVNPGSATVIIWNPCFDAKKELQHFQLL